MDFHKEETTLNISLNHHAINTPKNIFSTLIARGFAWCEAFILIGLHMFWVLSTSSPLCVDNAWGGSLALVPFLVMIILGAGSINTHIRKALIRLEAPFHWMACLLQTVLLVYVVFQDPFQPIFPLSLPLYVWSVAISFILAADLSVHLRGNAIAHADVTQKSPGQMALASVGLWCVVLWAASGASWVVYFWTLSIAAHAFMALLSLRHSGVTSVPAQPQPPIVARILPAIEGLALLSMFMAVQIRAAYCTIHMGAIAGKYPLFLDLFRDPVFFAGVGVLLLAARFHLTLFTHAALALVVLLVPNGLAWPLSLAFGYILPGLILATFRQCGFFYAVSCFIMSFVWLFGLAGFAFSGMIVHFQQGANEILLLARGNGAILVILLVLWGVCTMLVWRKGHQEIGESFVSSVRPAGIFLSTGVFCLVLVLATVPGFALLYKTAWPPRFLDRPATVALEEPMAVCHAGYSESEEEYTQLDALGVQALRSDFHWSGFQPGPDQWNLEAKDGYVDTAVAHGKHVIAILDFDNNAVEQDPAGKERGPYIAPADVPLFLEYVRRVVDRYKDRVYAWEIWNEPNMERFWAGSLDEFYDLARQTAETVRSVDASARIVGSAMTGPLGALTPPGIDGLHASGALAAVQHPSCHLYVTDPRHYPLEFAKILGAAKRFNHPGSIWVTEVGSPDGGYYPWASDSQQLADHVIKAYTAAASLGFELIVWYCFHDADAGSQAKLPVDSERFFGLLGPEDRWKPSAYAYRLFSRYCSHSVLRPDLVKVAGGLAARQLRTALCRRENGESALILWFEPILRPWGKARVHIDAGETDGQVTLHDIGSEYEKVLLDDTIEVTERPVFITFKSKDATTAVMIHTTSSPVDALWLIFAAGTIICAMFIGYIPVNKP
ncbi:MAG TPA: hypothetical protein PLI09_05235 [Candidatus Hydrogenedentes bacterium]|nr:hypothetical protein [Candidatus Hydrogenedentota bacterium]